MASDNCSKHGFISWGELCTRDTETAKDFYQKLFGWEYETCKSPSDKDYTIGSKEKTPVIGMMNLGDIPNAEQIPPHWGMYVTVDCIDTALKQAEVEGGAIIIGKTPLDCDSFFAFIKDPQGATLGLFECSKEK